jgi:hypothetical protein
MKNYQEDAESIALWQRAQLNPILKKYLYHVPNGGKRNPREAARMKRMGVRAGVHDYHLPVARGCYHGLWIELKPLVKGRRPSVSDSQYEWRDKMRDQGYASSYIVHGWHNAIQIMLDYLKLMTYEPLENAIPSSMKMDSIDEIL